MHTAFFAIGVAFLVVGVATIATGNDIAWSTFVTLGVVFLALAFALDRSGAAVRGGERGDEPPAGEEDV